MPYKNKEDQLACQRRWYHRNREKARHDVKKRKAFIKKWFYWLKVALKCKCGESHHACIDFHHTDKKGRAVSLLIRDAYSIKRIFKEIQSCEVLCANCHRKLHSSERHLTTRDRSPQGAPITAV